MKKANILLIIFLFVSSMAMGQVQLGQTLYELSSWSSSVNNVNYLDVSEDGNVFVYCNPREGLVKSFELVGNQWIQKGQSLTYRFGSTAVISDDGNTIVVNGEKDIHVYRWSGTQWIKSVSPEFDERFSLAGRISISSSGNRISSFYGDQTASYGAVDVFEWDGTRWNTLGDQIKINWALPAHKQYPKAELSGDGSTLVFGYTSSLTTLPLAEAYKYSGTEWIKMGEDIELVSSGGIDVSISNDGKVIALSGGYKISVVRWNGQSWEAKGTSIFLGPAYNNRIELDGSGNRIAFAEDSYLGRQGLYLGRIGLFEFSGERWHILGPQVQGDEVGNRFGNSMALSANGSVIVAASKAISHTQQSYIKAFKYDGVPYWPITYISGSTDSCDYESIANLPQYNVEFNSGPNYQYFSSGSSYFRLPVWDSIYIRPVPPPHYRADPSVSIFDSNILEAYKSQPGTYLRDTFCLIPNDLSSMDVRIDIITTRSPRPGGSMHVVLKVSNVGTVVASGDVEFFFDDQLQTIRDAKPIYEILGTNHLKWNYEQLLPLESRKIEISLNLNRPTDNPPLNDGDNLIYSAKVESVVGDINPNDNQTKASVEVVNSKDPNDKRCMQGDTISPESVGSALTYVIRFENEGTAEAIDIRIRDVIDTTMLDISTFEMLDASHDGYMVQISEGNIIDFLFKGINLPFDDANNDGYVAFNMHTKKHLQLGDAVKNDAAIYFDYNYPVITNEMITMVADQTTSIPTHNPHLGLSVYPNPASEMVRVNANTVILRIDLIDIQGRQLRQEVYINGGDKTREIPVAGLSQGIYWIRVTTDEGVGSIPLMVK